MIRHYCDECEKQLPRPVGAVREVSLGGTAENPIALTVDYSNPRSRPHPAICDDCLADRLEEAAKKLRATENRNSRFV